MVGATLSRWTMSYFAAALVALLCAEGLMALGYGFPAASIAAPETLVVVHIVAIGWLSLLMCGALFQFVPVLVARPIYSNSLPLPTLICLVAGLGALLLGFLQLAGQVRQQSAYFPAAAILLGIGFALVLWNLGRTLWAVRPLPLSARFVAVGLFSIGATAAFGIIFALVIGGVTVNRHLIDVTSNGIPLHVIAGLGGWLTFTAMGVSYRLLAMFMLAPELNGAATRGVFYSGAGALAVAVLGGTAAICANAGLSLVLAAAGLLGLAAFALYARDILHLYRERRRRAIELNSRMAGMAIANLAVSIILMVLLLGLGRFEQNVGALAFLVSFGWLSGLGLAKLYKVIAFLTWLECYGPVLGKMITPRVQDLVVEPRAVRWFALYFIAVWCAGASLLIDHPLAFRVAAGLMFVATIGIVVQLVRIRLLNDVQSALPLSGQIRRPRMLSAVVQHA